MAVTLPLGELLRGWRRALRDPLRGGPAAARWIASLPSGDALQLQREALDLVASFPGGRRSIGPAHPDTRQATQRSLIGPDDRFLPGGMVELDTGNARYLIRFTQTLERQAGWAWALFSAVRKLSP